MEKYIASCVVQLKNRKGKPLQARLRYPDASKKKGWSEISQMVPEEIKSLREARKWAEKWRAEMNAAADNMPSLEVNKTVGEMYIEYTTHQLNTGEIEKSTYNNSYYYFNDYGHITGAFWCSSDNDDSNIPNRLGEMIQAEINNYSSKDDYEEDEDEESEFPYKENGYCPYCGKQLTVSDAIFCTYCGSKLR